MRARSIRRAAEREAFKLARKAGLVNQNPQPAVPAVEPEPIVAPEPVAARIPAPPSPAQLAANRANAKLSHGPTSRAGLEISSQNRTVHGLTRVNGNFRLLSSEDPKDFEALKQSLTDEHRPTTATESILTNGMAESHWLSARAQRLQHTCIDSNSGEITDEKKAALYLRYETTHTRGFHKCLNNLLKLRSERRKAEIGFESQTIQKEKHEMKKAAQTFDLFDREVASHLAVCRLTTEKIKAQREFPGFEAEFEAELAKHVAAAA